MRPRIAYVGDHSNALLFMAVHMQLTELGVVHPDPGFLTFSPYWKWKISREFPSVDVEVFPTVPELWRARMWNEPPGHGSAFERGWKLDRIYRHCSYEKAARFWNLSFDVCANFLDRFSPLIVVSELLQTLPSFALYTSARRRGIPYVQLAPSRIAGRMDYFLGEEGIPAGLEHAKASDASHEIATAAVAAVRERRSVASIAARAKAPGRRLVWSEMKKDLAMIGEKMAISVLEPTAPSPLDPLLSKIRDFRAASRPEDPSLFGSLDDVRAMPGKKLFFPLQAPSDSTPALWAPSQSDVIDVARHIAPRVPSGWTLVMKEVPSSPIPQRRSSEIRELKGLDRSLLVSPRVNDRELIESCDAVVTVNSALGWDAMVLGMPVITIGRPFYELSGCTIPCPNLRDLGAAIEAINSFKLDQARLLEFVARYVESGDPGQPESPSMSLGALGEENVNRIADGLLRRFIAAGL